MENKIYLYFHCAKCDAENQHRAVSMKDYSRLAVGWTERGIQVWCHRHDMNVMAFDFLGQKIAYELDENDGEPK